MCVLSCVKLEIYGRARRISLLDLTLWSIRWPLLFFLPRKSAGTRGGVNETEG